MSTRCVGDGMAKTSKAPKDPTAAQRARRYRARKREQRHALASVNRDVTTVTAGQPAALPQAAIDRDACVTPSVTSASVTVPTTRPALLAVPVSLLGLITAAVGMYLNATFLWSFGRTSEAGAVLAVIGLVTDAATLVLPCVTTGLWARQRYVLAVTALALYVLAVPMTLLASLGFASTNVGDAVTGRAAAVQQRAESLEEIERLKTERARLQFAPATEQAVAAATIARDQECGRVGDNCRRRVAELAAVLQAKALTDKAAEIDTRIATLSRKLDNTPALAIADPQISGAVAVITWMTRGAIAPAAADIEIIRLLGVATMPVLGGLLIAFAMALMQPAVQWRRRSAASFACGTSAATSAPAARADIT
jgi:hypothetical protein